MYSKNIEIVEAYEIEDEQGKKLGWSIHAYLIDLGIDLRGIFAKKKSNGTWYIRMPSNKNVDQETKQIVQFPVFSFTDHDKSKQFLDALIVKITEFLKDKLIKDAEERDKQSKVLIAKKSEKKKKPFVKKDKPIDDVNKKIQKNDDLKTITKFSTKNFNK